MSILAGLLSQDQFHTAEAIVDAGKRALRISEAPIASLALQVSAYHPLLSACPSRMID